MHDTWVRLDDGSYEPQVSMGWVPAEHSELECEAWRANFLNVDAYLEFMAQ